ncbi:murein DD-endopeptidase MepM/ murein hydrolase activator NlpD [Ruminiclostridium sufflavum DSM 19573]|uniref:Murein DD-endopeptidase MepM/ murein hydrolase activator NlpD n=1 Tax=Ruminiclostridium sufflavum DSM 19573 TaxID=1121337 RepID=A0A318XMB3_9FIRM|nr:M23 family metallopeptidase [Ruminiclostridium sufflavum]PYG87842.1 murein DD-endopeptidase MepM/ murein hydrolase activator NlpD [Ruminiclostridium sufflavum DSM 19573]
MIKTIIINKQLSKILISFLLILSLLAASTLTLYHYQHPQAIKVSTDPKTDKKYIKWVEFNASYPAMEKALSLDVKSHTKPVQLHWVELLSYLAAKYGGNFKKYKSKDMDALAEKLNNGETMEQLTAQMKYYNYYYEAYDAILGNFVGEYDIQTKDPDNENGKQWEKKYGLKVFSPIAKGYSFTHYDDFGTGRTFGYARKHLGNDLMGSIGTPIIAVESGIIEVMGWNMYGGWRIGIRSFDQKRYYYYAHLRKDRPFHTDLYEGRIVKAGDVIGYLGMTGYSTRENVNNIKTPHLHFGMQIIFDESQKEGVNELWIDVYSIVNLLQKSRSSVVKDEETRDYYRAYDIIEPNSGYDF